MTSQMHKSAVRRLLAASCFSLMFLVSVPSYAAESAAAAQTTTVQTGTTTKAPPTAKKLPKMLDLGAGKCKSCLQMAPILEELKNTYAGKVDVEFIDLWKNPDMGDKYQIAVMPTQIFFDAEGKQIARHEGELTRAEILTKWREVGYKFE